ncbi:hypothetical protein [Geodermatophilus sp. SYSU D00815]
MQQPLPTTPLLAVGVPPAPVVLRVAHSRAARPGFPERRAIRALGTDLFDVRLAFATVGCGARVARFPEAADPDLAAVVTPVPGAADPALVALTTAARDRTVPSGTEEVLRRLTTVAADEGVQLVPVPAHLRGPGPARLLPWDGPGDGMLALLATRSDDRTAWLRAGEATERLLLELVPFGWTAAPLPGATDAPLDRTRLRSALVWDAHPQALLHLEALS